MPITSPDGSVALLLLAVMLTRLASQGILFSCTGIFMHFGPGNLWIQAAKAYLTFAKSSQPFSDGKCDEVRASRWAEP